MRHFTSRSSCANGPKQQGKATAANASALLATSCRMQKAYLTRKLQISKVAHFVATPCPVLNCAKWRPPTRCSTKAVAPSSPRCTQHCFVKLTTAGAGDRGHEKVMKDRWGGAHCIASWHKTAKSKQRKATGLTCYCNCNFNDSVLVATPVLLAPKQLGGTPHRPQPLG